MSDPRPEKPATEPPAPPPPGPEPESGYTPEEEDEVRKRLEDLGYVE